MRNLIAIFTFHLAFVISSSSQASLIETEEGPKNRKEMLHEMHLHVKDLEALRKPLFINTILAPSFFTGMINQVYEISRLKNTIFDVFIVDKKRNAMVLGGLFTYSFLCFYHSFQKYRFHQKKYSDLNNPQIRSPKNIGIFHLLGVRGFAL